NRKRFGDRPIDPIGEKGLDAALRYGPYTLDTSKVIAGVLRKIPGSQFPVSLGYRPRSDISPRQVDALIAAWTGAIGYRYAFPLADKVVTPAMRVLMPETALRLGIGKKIKFDRPTIERVLGPFVVKETDIGRGTLDRYYQLHESSKAAWQSFSNPEQTDEFARSYLKTGDNAARVARYHALQGAMQDLRTLSGEMSKAMDANDRKAFLDAYRKQVEVAKGAMELAEVAVKNPETRVSFMIQAEERRFRAEQQERRRPMRMLIEEMVAGGKERELAKMIDELDEAEQEWATGHWKKVAAEMEMTPTEKAIKSVPKYRRKAVTDSALKKAQ
ncbi:MAG TPA: LPD38 domain-containing protein, partial [Polyangia bacterium]|nr:LPD38 domain-containing protein [Polyangia bacterium]